VPPLEDGSKAPLGKGKEYQSRRPALDDLRDWYGTKGAPLRTGLGAVCGAVSGDLEVLEFDAAGEVYERLKARARALGLADLVGRLESGYSERSPSGGVHWLYRCETVSGSVKLAERYKSPEEFNDADRDAVARAAAKGKVHRPTRVLVETRG
jgi:putative DNA primase/helicase